MDYDFSKLTPAQEWLIVYLIGPLCSATGSNLIRQYRCVQSALRVMNGVQHEEDRIAAIASHTLRAAA